MMPQRAGAILATVRRPSEITFPANFGAPEKIQLADPELWTAHMDPGVKYFSGIAKYTTTTVRPAKAARFVADWLMRPNASAGW